MKRLSLALLVAGTLVAPSALARDIKTMLPLGYKLASTVTKVPTFVPGLGELYVDPTLLPLGPYVGYDENGKLMNAVYLIPMSQMTKHKEWQACGKAISGFRTNHVDITFSAGEPGMSEPHYRIVQWTVAHDIHLKGLKSPKGKK